MSKKKVKKPSVEIPAGVRMFIGIDPGASGGIVCLDGLGQPGSNWIAASMPKTRAKLWRALKSLATVRPSFTFAVVEQVGGYVGGNPTPGSSMFNFGVNYGELCMALGGEEDVGLGVPFVTVPPATWMKALGLKTKKEIKTPIRRSKKDRRRNETDKEYRQRLRVEWKAYLQAEARKRFPKAKISLKTADAFLIAFYCRQLCEQARRESA